MSSSQFGTPEPANSPQYVESAGRRIACLKRAGSTDRPCIVWLGGFKSDMRSTKAERLDAWAASTGRAFLRFDYSGHGESSGAFDDGTIGAWLEDALAAISAHAPGRLILVGSSMGGWMSLLVARALAAKGEAARLAGTVLIAPAVDFTQELMWAGMDEAVRREIMETGRWLRPSAYSPEPYAITRALIEEGRDHLLFGASIRSHCPVHILQGMQDEDVPWAHAQRLVEAMPLDPVTISYVPDGDHRLSRDEDIARLIAAVEAIA